MLLKIYFEEFLHAVINSCWFLKERKKGKVYGKNYNEWINGLKTSEICSFPTPVFCATTFQNNSEIYYKSFMTDKDNRDNKNKRNEKYKRRKTRNPKRKNNKKIRKKKQSGKELNSITSHFELLPSFQIQGSQHTMIRMKPLPQQPRPTPYQQP
ncbi:hypothetical protein BC829DRAFT_407907 [Chytridium lagenaria]|nr:hypothetical protein BC829DRAFT_407907 [Chytridium lagenaria]